jgi:hypothetical protein
VYDLDGQIIEFSLIIAIIACNLVIKQWIIFILGQNNFLDKTRPYKRFQELTDLDLKL